MDVSSFDFGIIRSLTDDEHAAYLATRTEQEWARDYLFEKIPFLHWSEPETAQLIYAFLQRVASDDYDYESLVGGSDEAAYFILAALFHSGITSCASIRAPWIDDDEEGERLIAALDTVTDWDEWWRGRNFPVPRF